MRFHSNVTLFNMGRISLLGNFDTGCVIGLTKAEVEICQQMFCGSVPAERIRAVDVEFLERLEEGSFFAPAEHVQGLDVAYLHVTQKCNLNCKGCYSDDDQRNTLVDASFGRICKAIKELSDFGIQSLVISGGEPFLRDDLVEIVSYAKTNCGIPSVAVLTNGTHLDEAVLKRLAPIIDLLSVSFDGCSEEAVAYIRGEQRFRQLVNAVQSIKKAGISAHIIPTIHSKNVKDIEDYVRLASELGVTLNFSLLSCGLDAEMEPLLLKEEDLIELAKNVLHASEISVVDFLDSPVGVDLSVKKKCGAGSRLISVAADGRVFPCHMLHYDEFCLGNLFSESLGAILAKEQNLCFQDALEEGCSEKGRCKYGALCGGGCVARSFLVNGNLNGLDPYCGLSKRYFELLESKFDAMLDS